MHGRAVWVGSIVRRTASVLSPFGVGGIYQNLRRGSCRFLEPKEPAHILMYSFPVDLFELKSQRAASWCSPKLKNISGPTRRRGRCFEGRFRFGYGHGLWCGTEDIVMYERDEQEIGTAFDYPEVEGRLKF